jgi:predicted DNA-binding transcriptional regulator AlpA
MAKCTTRDCPALKTEIHWTLPSATLDDLLERFGRMLAETLVGALRDLGSQLPGERTGHRCSPDPDVPTTRMRENTLDSHVSRERNAVQNLAEHGLVSVRTVASMLGISQRQVWKLVAAERFPGPLRLGRSVRWRATEIRSWVDAGCPARERWEALRG